MTQLVTRRRRTRDSPTPSTSDPDPITAQHFMFVLGWQVNHPNHKLAEMSVESLAKLVRGIARDAIREAMEEIEADEYENYYQEIAA